MFGFLSSLSKTSRWNNDPNQKVIVSEIYWSAVYKCSNGEAGEPLDIKKMIKFTDSCGWRDKEAADRFVHAVSMIKVFADTDIYHEAKEEALSLYQAYLA